VTKKNRHICVTLLPEISKSCMKYTLNHKILNFELYVAVLSRISSSGWHSKCRVED